MDFNLLIKLGSVSLSSDSNYGWTQVIYVPTINLNKQNQEP